MQKYSLFNIAETMIDSDIFGPPPRVQVAAGLEPYSPTEATPWNRRRVAHLLRRTGFSAPADRVAEFLNLQPEAAVDRIVNEALAFPLPPDPPFASVVPPPPSAPPEERDAFRVMNVEAKDTLRITWFRSLYENGLRERMALFWSNHFVTQAGIYFYTAYAHQYLKLLRTHALGDFKQFVYDIGLTPAMILYLDLDKNVKGNPNENYARELLELFTTGLGQYTQEDIREIARALTGWSADISTLSTRFNPDRYDGTEKTFFGRTGAFGYDEVIDIIFEERAEAVARFICEKLYKEFVYANPDEAIVGQLADLFIASEFRIEPVVRALLKSAHFFDDTFIGSRIKGPVELFASLMPFAASEQVSSGAQSLYDRGMRTAWHWGQVLLDPPNVAGWKGDRSWISSGNLVSRWQRSTHVYQDFELDHAALMASVSNPGDPRLFAREVAEVLIALPLTDEEYDLLGDILLGGQPEYEWNPASPGGQSRMEAFVRHIIQMPAFQLT